MKLKSVFAILFSIFTLSNANVLDSINPGEWFEIPNSKLSSVLPNPLPAGNPGSIISTWSGGSFDTKRDRLIVWGGGHSDYAGNEIYVFDMESLKWTRLTDPSPYSGGDEKTGEYTDGNPRSRHTYDYIQYVPAIDKFCSFGGSGLYPSGQINTNKVHCFDFVSKTWTNTTTTLGGGYIGAISDVDNKTGLVWLHPAGGGSYLSSWDPISNVWIKRANYNAGWFDYYCTGAAGNGHFLAIGGGKLIDWDLNNPNNQSKNLNTTGATELINKANPGLVYVDSTKKFYGWMSGKDIYSFGIGDTSWNKLPIASTNKVIPTNNTQWGTFGRFQYCKSKNVFIIVNDIYQNVFVYKFGLSSPTTIPPGPITPPLDSTPVTKKDTVFVTVHDTIKVTNTVTVHDTIKLVSIIHDTINTINSIHDTLKIMNTIHDTLKIKIKESTKLIPLIPFDTIRTSDTTMSMNSKIDTSIVFSPSKDTTKTPPIIIPPVVNTEKYITSVIIKNNSAIQLGVPFTFGQILKQGDLKLGQSIVAKIGDKIQLSQFDSKAYSVDNSVRHGIMSLVIDTLKFNEDVKVDLYSTDVTDTSKTNFTLPDGFSIKVKLITNGKTYTSVLNNLDSKLWLNGKVVKSFLKQLPLSDSLGNIETHLNTIFEIRQYQSNVRVDVAIENCWTYEPNPSGYVLDANIYFGDSLVFSQTGIKQPHQTRWRKVIWYKSYPNVTFVTDKIYLTKTGAFPYYDITLPISQSTIDKWPTSFPIMSNGNLTNIMGNAGAQPGIGLLPQWSALYLVTANSKLRDNVIANGEAGGSYPIHYRNKLTKNILTIDEYPYITELGNPENTYNPTTKKYESLPVANDTLSKYSPDDAHQPSIAYLPYILTGDYYLLDELKYWVNWNMLIANPEYRQTTKGLLYWGQVRSQAWGIRSLGQAAFILPSDDELKPYFIEKLNNNIDWYIANVVTGPRTTPLNYIDAKIYSPYGFAPWMDNFFTSAFGYIIQLGFNNAKPIMTYKAKFATSLMVDTGYCWLRASAYGLQHSDPAGNRYTTMSAMYKANYPTETCLGNEMIGYPSDPFGYGANLQPALALSVDCGEDNALKAWAKYETRNPKQNYLEAPHFNVIPKVVLDSLIN